MARQNIDFNSFVPEDLTKSTIDWGTVMFCSSTGH